VEAQAARFDFAAQKLNLDEGLMLSCGIPHEIIRTFGDDGQWSSEVFTGFRVALHRPRPAMSLLFARRRPDEVRVWLAG
jgi:hypothetical protein